MIKYFMLWYRAKTYCPVIDSLRTEPEMWVKRAEYQEYKRSKYKPRNKYDTGPYLYVDSSSLFHKDLDIEITYWDWATRGKEVKRNGHILPVHKGRLKRALRARENAAAQKVIDDAKAELNRVVQDAQTLRLARIVELRKALATAEAADFAYRLENGS